MQILTEFSLLESVFQLGAGLGLGARVCGTGNGLACNGNIQGCMSPRKVEPIICRIGASALFSRTSFATTAGIGYLPTLAAKNHDVSVVTL